MSNSPLVSYTKISPNSSSRNGTEVDTITPHHMAGDLTVETCGEVFASPARQASANYGIGSDGRVALYVDESQRAWTSSNAANDRRAVTIEVANCSTGGAWPVSNAAWDSLVALCVDICKRNGIASLSWTGDANGSLTCHYMFAATECPGPYLKGRMGLLADTVNSILAGNGSSPEVPSGGDAANDEGAVTTESFGGTYRCTVNDLRVRTGPGLSYPQATSPNGSLVYYSKGMTVVLDDWYKIADGWVWGRYTGSTTGLKRYIAVGKATGKPEPDDYLIKC